MESAMSLLHDYIQDSKSSVSTLDLSLDNNLASLVTADTMEPWQKLIQFKLAPALKVMKHSYNAAFESAPPQAPMPAFEPPGPNATAATLREQIAVSEQQILDQRSQLLHELSTPSSASQQHVAALEERNRELERELSAMEHKPSNHPDHNGSTQPRFDELTHEIEAQRERVKELELENQELRRRFEHTDGILDLKADGNQEAVDDIAQLEQCGQEQKARIAELEQMVFRIDKDRVAALEEFEHEMLKGQALNQELCSKYTQLQQKANDTMKKLKQLKVQLQEKEQHREQILSQAQTSFKELKEKYVALEQSHQERKHLLKTNEWNRLELNKMVERIRELEELQTGKDEMETTHFQEGGLSL
eukprot:TRINITY_DN28347_c0_g1_i2.p1 TRINITY_DN28347_c0_g1~~TRINITY_DN28347_c0_g1_i2.p1  ORF type:complete len:362 (+),score=73.59 TRINITY_DN28347_c0_g1_i2:215-1300(+)